MLARVVSSFRRTTGPVHCWVHAVVLFLTEKCTHYNKSQARFRMTGTRVQALPHGPCRTARAHTTSVTYNPIKKFMELPVSLLRYVTIYLVIPWVTLQEKVERVSGARSLSYSKEWRDRNGQCSSPCGVGMKRCADGGGSTRKERTWRIRYNSQQYPMLRVSTIAPKNVVNGSIKCMPAVRARPLWDENLSAKRIERWKRYAAHSRFNRDTKL